MYGLPWQSSKTRMVSLVGGYRSRGIPGYTTAPELLPPTTEARSGNFYCKLPPDKLCRMHMMIQYTKTRAREVETTRTVYLVRHGQSGT